MNTQLSRDSRPSLTEEEYHRLLLPNPKKKRSKIIKIALGLLLEIVAALIFIFSWTFDFLTLDMNYEEGMPYVFNVSVIVGIILSLAGFLLIGSFTLNNDGFRSNDAFLPSHPRDKEMAVPLHKTTRQTQLKLPFIPISRLIAALVFIVMAYWNYRVFGIFFAMTNHLGNFFFLNGPSMWIPMSALPTIAVIWFLGYALLSTRLTNLSQSANLIFFKEYGLRVPTITEIPKSKIIGYRFGPKKDGSAYLWVFLLGFNTVRCILSGAGFLFGEYAYGTGLIVGKMYLITALSDLIGITVLVIGAPSHLRIFTATQEYDLKISIALLSEKKRNLFITSLQENFGMDESGSALSSVERQGTKQSYGPLIIGGFFILTGIISNIFQVYIGIGFQKILYVFGFYLIIKNLRENTRRRATEFLQYQPNGKKNKISLNQSLRKLNLFDILMGIFFPVTLAMDSFAVGYFDPSGISNMIHISGTFVIFLLLNLYYLLPTDPKAKDLMNIWRKNSLKISLRILFPLFIFFVTGFILGFTLDYLLYRVLFGIFSGIFLSAIGYMFIKYR